MIRIGTTAITAGIIILMASDWLRDTRVAGLAVFAAGYLVAVAGIVRQHVSSAKGMRR